jgi:ATP-dependent RNA helicase DeaD
VTTIFDETETTQETPAATGAGFAALGLSADVVRAIAELGFELPTPIQAQTIPLLLAGNDVIGQAQTGTGKTAAFGLPLLDTLDQSVRSVQALILTPTRELAIQIADALYSFSRYRSFKTLAVYGGQPIERQITRLANGTQIVVGTPGRIMDHLRRGSLTLDAVQAVILDEADEMLDMGFVEDVEWILAHTPAETRQTGLFSATLPPQVLRLANNYMRNPQHVSVAREAMTVPNITQRYYVVREEHKLEALARVLEVEEASATLIFSRTKIGAAQLVEELQRRGYAVDALHGDMSQMDRESVLRKFRSRQITTVVATDVAARGLDIDNISHVINYDMPFDPESYVHHIGRTGRAGREGVAISLITPRERRLLRDVERYIGKPIELAHPPRQAEVAKRRAELFKQRVRELVAGEELVPYSTIVNELAAEGLDLQAIAAAVTSIAAASNPRLLSTGKEPDLDLELRDERPARRDGFGGRGGYERGGFGGRGGYDRDGGRGFGGRGRERGPEQGMVRLQLNAGRRNGVRPQDIVGAIANEAGIPGRAIGAIDIQDTRAFVEVPAQYQHRILERMAQTSLRGQPVSIRLGDRAR